MANLSEEAERAWEKMLDKRRTSDSPREMTKEEVREAFLKHIWGMVDFWLNESRRPDTREKLAGLAFSILAMLDGSSMDLPGFIVAPLPHPENKQCAKDDKYNWFPQNEDSKVNCDIAGGEEMHHVFQQFDPQRKEDESRPT